MRKRFITATGAAAGVLALAFLAGCPNDSGATDIDLVPTVQELAARINAGDIDGAVDLFSEDAHWEFPHSKDFTVERRSFANAWSLDHELNAHYAVEDCRQEGLTVTCTVIETNDWLGLHGLPPSRSPNARFVFNADGKIERLVWGERDKELHRQMRPIWIAFEKWATENYRDEFEKMVVPGEKRLRWNAETGRILMKLGREWVEAGRPGLEEARRRVEQNERNRQDAERSGDEAS